MEEDARGEPFVGQAGRLLDNMLAAIGLTRAGTTPQSVYIANVLKCRPPGNRNPAPGEVASCDPFLKRQIELVNPKLVAGHGSLRRTVAAGDRCQHREPARQGPSHRGCRPQRLPVIVTYHPAYLLRNLADKAKSWADLCFARDVVERGALVPVLRRSAPRSRTGAGCSGGAASPAPSRARRTGRTAASRPGSTGSARSAARTGPASRGCSGSR